MTIYRNTKILLSATYIFLILFQLLISLFRKNTEIIECDNYIFVPIVIDIHIFKKFLNNYIEKFLDLFDNWKKIQDNTLIKNLWECFLGKLNYCTFFSS